MKSEPIEQSGKNVEEILKELSLEWECLPEDIEYTVVHEGRSGIMGFGSKDWVIKAQPPRSGATLPPRQPRGERKEREPRRGGERAERPLSGGVEDNRGNLKGPGEAGSSQARPARPRESDPAVLEKARKTLEDLIHHLFPEGTVKISAEEPGTLEIEGETGGLLIGRRGQTLDAIQFLLNKMVYREEVGSSPRIQIDVAGYRARRAEALENLALRMASKARQGGRPLRLEPMPAHERRIIHITLEGQEGVRTESEGQGEHKRVVIIPERRGGGGGGGGGRPQGPRGNGGRGRGRRGGRGAPGGPPGPGPGPGGGGGGPRPQREGNVRPSEEELPPLDEDDSRGNIREDAWRERVGGARPPEADGGEEPGGNPPPSGAAG